MDNPRKRTTHSINTNLPKHSMPIKNTINHLVSQKPNSILHENASAKFRAIKSTKPIGMKEAQNTKTITLGVPQGVGDIFWIYQKFSKHFLKINFNILATDRGKISTRAIEWLNLLPKVGDVTIKDVHGTTYERVINQKHKMKDIVTQFNAGVNNYFYFACNKPLEEGVRIEDIDPDFQIEETVDLKMGYFEPPYPEYTLIYASGHSLVPSEERWFVDKWCEFFEMFHNEILQLPYVIIGASYDEKIAHKIFNHLNDKKIPCKSYIDQNPAIVCDIMKKSRMFIGYQSGLNIIADNLNVPQFMLYFPHLERMQYSWCKKGNIKEKFLSTIFNMQPQDCISYIKNNELYNIIT